MINKILKTEIVTIYSINTISKSIKKLRRNIRTKILWETWYYTINSTLIRATHLAGILAKMFIGSLILDW